MTAKATPADYHEIFEDAGPIQRANLVGFWIALPICSAIALFGSPEGARILYLLQLISGTVAIYADRKFTSILTKLYMLISPLIVISLIATIQSQ